MPRSVAALSTFRLSWGEPLLSKSTTSNFGSFGPALALTCCTTSRSCLSELCPVSAKGPESRSMKPMRTVSAAPAWAAAASRAVASQARRRRVEGLNRVMRSPGAPRRCLLWEAMAGGSAAFEHAAMLVAQLVFLHLAGAAQGQAVDEQHLIGQPPLGHALGQKVEHLLLAQFLAGLEHDEHQRAVVPARVLHADHRSHGHGGVGHGRVFEVDRADPFTARLDHVLGAIADLHHALGVDGGDVTSGEPAVHQGRALGLVVALHDPLAAHHQLTL